MTRFILSLLFILCLFLANNASAQSVLGWEAYSSFNFVKNSTIDSENRTWITTDGGVAVISNGQIERTLTPIDGLSRLNGNTIHYNESVNKIFIGYVNGIIDIIDPENYEVSIVEDIFRNSVFTSKSISKFISHNNSLFVGTDFGIVEFDLTSLFVSNTYLKLGNFESGIPITDMFLFEQTLYVATTEGIASIELDGDLGESDWINFDNTNGFVSEEVQAIGAIEDLIYASTSTENYIFENDIWSVFSDFTGNLIKDYESQSGVFLALSDKNLFVRGADGSFSSSFISGTVSTTLTTGVNEGDFKFGTFTRGLSIANQASLSIQFTASSGPFLNTFDGLNFDGNILIAGSTRRASEVFVIENGKGFYTYDGNEWTNYNQYTNTEINSSAFRLAFTSEITDQYYYFGSWGRGIARLDKETKEVVIFDETNSTLRGYPADDENFPVIIGLDADSEGDIWAVSRFGVSPLYRQTPGDDDWQSFEEDDAVNSSDLYEGLFIDSFDQKWIPLQNSQASGTGLLIIDTGVSGDETDDVGVKLQFGSNNGNLPDNEVNAIIQDKNGEVWIGTERGIAKFIFPELIIDGSIGERTAQWLINEDTSAVSRFLLRDVNVSTMAINSANQKWIGSENQGIWVLNAEGSRIEQRFTTDNSPLYSNNIRSIAVNENTGEVFIATNEGLISYLDIPKKPLEEMDKLKVFPNPFSYSRNTQILIEGLSDETFIKILGIDGFVVRTLDSKGGRINWDGRDNNGNKLGTGVYFVVAVDNDGGSKGLGKVVIVK